MKKSLKVSLIAIFAVFFSFSSHSQVVDIQVSQPDYSKFHFYEMWNFSLTNPSSESIQIYIKAELSEQNDGTVVIGTSAMFELGPNFNGKIPQSWLKPAEVNNVNSDYKEIFERYGKAPPGNYTLCITGYNEKGIIVGQDCIVHSVVELQAPILVSPANDEKIANQPVTFSFTPVGPMQMGNFPSYMLKIYEVGSNQTATEASLENLAWFVKKDITSTHFQLSSLTKSLEPEKEYAWCVFADVNGDGKYPLQSEVWSFIVNPVIYQLTIDSSKIVCSGTNCYSFKVWVSNNNSPNPAHGITSIGEVVGLEVEPTTTSSISYQSNQPSFFLTYSTQKLIAGEVCFNEPVAPPIKFKITFQDKDNPTEHNGTTTYYIDSLPECPCCIGFTTNIRQIIKGNKMRVLMKAGPQKICKVSMKLAYVKSVTDNNCPVCKSDWKYWGVFSGLPSTMALGPFGPPSETHLREITWGGDKAPGYDISNFWIVGNIDIMLDPVMSGIIPADILECCKTDIEYCIRYSFMDTTCITCDTVICYRMSYDGTDNIQESESTEVKDTILSFGEQYNIRENGYPVEQGLYLVSDSFNDSDEDESKKISQCNTSFSSPEEQPLFMPNEHIAKQQPLTDYLSDPNPSRLSLYFHAPPPPPPTYPVKVTITSDNAYVFGFGDVDKIIDYRDQDAVCNLQAGQIYNSYGPETYNISANMDSYIYIAAWSDEHVYQGLIAQFTGGGTTIVTSPNLPNPNVYWEVYATGDNLYCGNSATIPTDPPPTLISINNQIGTATDNNLWVKTNFEAGKDGALVFGPQNQVSPPFPVGTIDSINLSAQWMWWRPNESVSITGTFFTGNLPNFPATLSKEYYIFRVGPIGELLPPPDCCEDFNIKIKSGVRKVLSRRDKYAITASLSAGPNKIRRVTADIIDFSMSYNSSLCEPCANNSDLWGNFILNVPSIPGLGSGKLTIPPGKPSKVSREIVWGSLYSPAIDMTGSIKLTLNLSLPPKHLSSCCLDRINLCVKYTFTDEFCITCDTVICYTIYRPEKWDGAPPYPPMKDYEDAIDWQEKIIMERLNPVHIDGGTGSLENVFIEVETIQEDDSELVMDKAIDTSCNCGHWNNKTPFTLQMGNGISKGTWCGQTHRIKNKKSSVLSIKADGHTCVQPNCSVTYIWEVRAMDNSLIKSGNGSEINYGTHLTGISFPIMYNVVFYAVCNGIKCKTPCILIIDRQRVATKLEKDSRKL